MTTQSDPQPLLERLRSLQADTSHLGWTERRDALASALEHEMARVPRDGWRATLGALRTHLLEAGSSGGAAAGVDVERLEHELSELRHERDALRAGASAAEGAGAELAKLREENRQLRERIQQAGGGGDDAFGAAVEQLAAGKEVDPATLPLSERDRRTFAAIRVLFSFACDNDVISSNMMLALSGDIDMMDTNALRGIRREFRKRFQQALEDPEQGGKRLRDVLSRSLQLMTVLADAIPKMSMEGTQKILAEMDPAEIVEKHTRSVLGTDFAAAYKTITREHEKVSRYLSAQIWEIYFQPLFRTEMARFLEP